MSGPCGSITGGFAKACYQYRTIIGKLIQSTVQPCQRHNCHEGLTRTIVLLCAYSFYGYEYVAGLEPDIIVMFTRINCYSKINFNKNLLAICFVLVKYYGN